MLHTYHVSVPSCDMCVFLDCIQENLSLMGAYCMTYDQRAVPDICDRYSRKRVCSSYAKLHVTCDVFLEQIVNSTS